MIDIRDEDIVRRRQASDGRFVLFTRTDLPERMALPWFGVVLDTGGDGHGILVTLDPVADAWSAGDLLDVAQARAFEQLRHRPDETGVEVVRSLAEAGALLGRYDVRRVRFEPGPVASPYSWTEVRLGEHRLPLRPDGNDGGDEGVTLEQLVIVLDQLLADARVIRERRPHLRRVRYAVLTALAALQGRQGIDPT